MDFSALMSVYYKEKPENLLLAIKSVFEQTHAPLELVLVRDGPIGAPLQKAIDHAKNIYPIKLVPIEKNLGLGPALNHGLKFCKSDIIARADSDDISVRERFGLQLSCFEKNPDLHLVGGLVEEFINRPKDTNRIKKVPLTYDQILQYSRKRNPFNHPTVMFKKKSVETVGSYENIPLFEDYHLWLKLLNDGFSMSNLDKVLVYFRIGNGMIERRMGWDYLRKEYYFAMKSYRSGLFSFLDFGEFIISRLPLRLFPKAFMRLVYISLRK